MEGKFIRSHDNSVIYYDSYGQSFPLILLHGNGSNGRYFSNQIDFFSQYFTVITMDSRDHGNSENLSNQLNFEMLSEDLRLILDNEQIKNCNIVGFSDGANLAIKFASKFPNYVNKLVLDAPNISLNGLDSKTVFIDQLLFNILRGLSSFFPFFKKLARKVSLMSNPPDISEEEVRSIAADTLVLCGEFDIIKVSHLKWITKLLKKAKLKIILKGTHNLPRQLPKTFNRVVLDFLLEKGEFKK